MILLQLLLSAALTGAVYALMAVGFALSFTVARVVNLAHGAFFALGAYLAYSATRLGLSPVTALPIAVVAAAAAGASIDRLLLARLRQQPLAEVVLTLGIALLAEVLFAVVWGPFYLTLPASGVVRLGALILDRHQLAAAVMVSLTLGSLGAFLRTRAGLGVRVTAFNPEIAILSGIPVEVVQRWTLGAAAAMAASAGTFLAPLLVLSPTMGRMPLLLSLVIVVAGGTSLRGVVAAALAIGLGSHLISFYAAPAWSYIGVLVMIAGLLLLHPRGLFGRSTGASW